MKRPSSIGVLALVLAVFVGIMLIDRARSDDGGSSPGAAPRSTAPATTEPVIEPGTAPSPANTATPGAADVEPLVADDAAPSVMVAAPAAIAMPSTSQFGSVRLAVKATLDISNLTGMIWNNRLGSYYAISQDGVVYRISADLALFEQVLDLRSEVTELAAGSERGMLGIAFDPRDGRMFLYFTDNGGDTNVVSMAMLDGKPDPSTRRSVLFVQQPGLGHKAGDLVFDPDGTLYVALGDGGASRGADAQDPSKLLGKILRIIPKLDGDGYEVPADNPFVGHAEIRPEIWALGLRNPWQIWRDPVSGDWYVGDVGESDIEELNYLPAGTAGVNFGWPYYEGSNGRDSVLGPIPDAVPFTPPIVEYPHSEGVAIIAGSIYYGSAIPELRGAFVYADMTGVMWALGTDGSKRLAVNVPGVATTFVQTPEGELLVTTLREGILRLVPG